MKSRGSSSIVKVILLRLLTVVWALGCSHALAQGTLLRFTCDKDNIGAEISVNGQFKGECPLDAQVPAGTIKIEAIKNVDAQRKRVFVQDMRVGDGVTKHVQIVLGSVQLNVQGRPAAAGQQQSAEEAREPVSQASPLASATLFEQAEQLAALTPRALNLMQPPAPTDVPAPLSENDRQANVLYQQASDVGHPMASLRLAERYETGQGAPVNGAMAFQFYQRAAKKGQSAGMGGLASMYFVGMGVAKDHALALAWARQGAELEDSRSMNLLGRLYEMGVQGQITPDEAQALQWIQRAAAAGDPHAQVSLAGRYMIGKGVAKDELSTGRLYLQAAKTGNSLGMTLAGVMYQLGIYGVTKNEQAAVLWYGRAAAAGNTTAMVNLGKLYDVGFGVEKNPVIATAWAKVAREQTEAMQQARALIAPTVATAPKTPATVQSSTLAYSLTQTNGNLTKEMPATVVGNLNDSHGIDLNAGFAALKAPLLVQVEVGTRFPRVRFDSKLTKRALWGEYVLVNCVNVSDHCQGAQTPSPFSMGDIYIGNDIYPDDYCKPYSFQVQVRWVFDGVPEKGKTPRFQGIAHSTPFGPFLSTFKDDCSATNKSTAAVATASTAQENKPQPPVVAATPTPAPSSQGDKTPASSKPSAVAEAETCNRKVGQVLKMTKAQYVKSMNICLKNDPSNLEWGTGGEGDHGTPEGSCKNVLAHSSPKTACYCFETRNPGESSALNEGDWVCWVASH